MPAPLDRRFWKGAKQHWGTRYTPLSVAEPTAAPGRVNDWSVSLGRAAGRAVASQLPPERRGLLLPGRPRGTGDTLDDVREKKARGEPLRVGREAAHHGEERARLHDRHRRGGDHRRVGRLRWRLLASGRTSSRSPRRRPRRPPRPVRRPYRHRRRPAHRRPAHRPLRRHPAHRPRRRRLPHRRRPRRPSRRQARRRPRCRSSRST